MDEDSKYKMMGKNLGDHAKSAAAGVATTLIFTAGVAGIAMMSIIPVAAGVTGALTIVLMVLAVKAVENIKPVTYVATALLTGAGLVGLAASAPQAQQPKATLSEQAPLTQ